MRFIDGLDSSIPAFHGYKLYLINSKQQTDRDIYPPTLVEAIKKATLVTVSDPCKPLKTVGVHVSMSVRAGAQVIIDPVAPVSNMASVEGGWIEVVVTVTPGRLIWQSPI